MNREDEKLFASLKVEQTFMQRVYQWMAAGLAVTGFIAYAVSGNIELLRALAGGGFLILMLAEIGLVIWLSTSIMKISVPAALAGFLVYSALNGVTLSYVFAAYTGASIVSTFLITAGSFAGVSIFASVTQSDLSSMRSFFVMGLIGFLVASIVNIFFQSPVFDWIISYVGLALFIGLTAYDTQQLKAIQRSGTSNEQLAIRGALKLYLDFINMFLLLLRLFGRRR